MPSTQACQAQASWEVLRGQLAKKKFFLKELVLQIVLDDNAGINHELTFHHPSSVPGKTVEE